MLILCVGLALVASAAVLWVRAATMDSRLQMMGLLSQEIADRVAGDGDIPVITKSLDELIGNRKRYFKLNDELCVTITGTSGQMFYNDGTVPPQEIRKRLNEEMTAPVNPDFVTVSTPIYNKAGTTIGHVTLIQTRKALVFTPHQNGVLAILLIGLAVFGWLTVYLLSRKLSRPIRQVAAAARQVSHGSYDIRLDGEWREREIGELVGSFKEMTSRLRQLEEWRTLMMAGITHELKTPVTSVKGLVHAVREGVVQGKEADEFLDIALKETDRLQTMVADLLDYDALAAGFVTVRRERLDAGALIAEIVHQWNVVHEPERPLAELEPVAPGLELFGDPFRIQQIVVNLLNNARQAEAPGRPLAIALRTAGAGGMAEVVVADNGRGIRENERDFVFERFFRGEEKRQRIRGLGLGLTFSRMLARAQGGDLLLVRSSSDGSEFALRLPLAGSVREDAL
ncbi:hypothetical protein GCM10020370_45300 [Paenibacillus hodogayensis]